MTFNEDAPTNMNNNLSLVSFLSTDQIKLPGLLYEPVKKTDKVALYLHGNGSSSIFYGVEETNIFAKYLIKNNISFFPFNNRGSNYITRLHQSINGKDTRIKYGTAFELIKDCIYDIDGAIDFLKEKGYKTFYLIGISTGANKIVVYDHYKPENDVSKYILLSGGDDTGLYYQQLGKKKFMMALKRAKEEIEKGNGRKFVPKFIVDYYFSWQSLYDTINPDGDYNIFPFNEYIHNLKISTKQIFGEFKKIKKPSFVIYGELDEYCYGNVPRCVEILEEQTKDKNNFRYKIIPQADHGFTGKEEELAKIINGWL